MSRRVWIIGLAAVGVLIVGAALFLILQPNARPGVASEPVASPTAQAPGLSEPDAQRIESALGSGDPAQVSAAVVVPEGGQVDPAFVAQLAELKVDIDPGTFTMQDESTAIVDATAGGKPWVLVLQKGGNLGWLVASTVDLT